MTTTEYDFSFWGDKNILKVTIVIIAYLFRVSGMVCCPLFQGNNYPAIRKWPSAFQLSSKNISQTYSVADGLDMDLTWYGLLKTQDQHVVICSGAL